MVNRNGVAVVDGLHGASSPYGGTVSGSGTNTLTITDFSYSDAGTYTLEISNFCGGASSTACMVGMPCPADFNANNSLDVVDIFAFLTAWFAGCPPLPAACPADFNGFGGLTVADIFAFLTAWFAGCP